MQKAANIIVDDHAGKFPREYEQVLALPGIGRYTAGAICSIAFNEPRPILDGNVMRVLTRIFGIGQNPRVKETNEQLWEISERLVRQAGSGSAKNGRACSQLNQALMELGALVCKPRQPRCEVCPVSKYCTAYREGRVEELPNLERRLPPTQRRFMAFVAQQKNLFWVRQRPAGVVNAHLWEFPNLEVATTDGDFRTAARNVLGRSWLDLEPLTTVRHSITRYRIRLDVFRARTKSARSSIPAEGAWCSRAQLDALAFASAHKKIVATLPHPPPSQEHKETAF
jgi:A/G-specific adenine glycosylase